MKGDMWLARSTDEEILKCAECGGVVTSLLKFALERNLVDVVLAVEAREGNRFDGIPVLLTNPEDVIRTAGSLHCSSPNIARFIKEYLGGAFDLKVATVCKPCDARAIIELAKRNQIDLGNLLLIGLNCTGTLPSAGAKEMFREEFGVDPAEVVREDIDEGKLSIWLRDGTKKEKDLGELEEKGYGRRENCRRCDFNIPRMADIACGKWGTEGVKDGKVTFVEICSDKGSELVEKAVQAGVIKVESPSSTAMETRRRKDEEEIERARKWQERDFAFFKEMSTEERFDYWSTEFSQCIKCFGCRDACPICYCKDCSLEADRGIVAGGEVPPSVMFPMIRTIHVMDSCVNCGQCQDACPSELPLSRFIHMLNKEISAIFKYEPGLDVETLPPLRSVTDKELTMPGVEVAV